MLGDVMLSPQRLERRLRAARRAEAEAESAEGLAGAGAALAAALAPDAAAAAEDALQQARVSAEETAALRKEPKAPAAAAVGGSGEQRQPPVSEDGRQPCKYAGLSCAGCGEPFDLGQEMIRGGRGMVHDDARCRELAERRLLDEAQERRAGGGAKSKAQSEKREAQLSHRFSAERVAVLRCCVEGRCRVDETQEQRTFCRKGCGRGVHVMQCLQMSKHRASLGSFVCGECRADEIAPHSCSAVPRLIHEGDVSALLELATGAEGTASNHSDYTRLERLWVEEMCGGEDGATPGSVVLPRHSEQSYIAFLHWLVRDADRKRSFSTIVRASTGVFAKLELTNWAGTKRVKAVIKELEQSHGVEAVPCTHATRRILTIVMEDTLPARCGGGLLTRSSVQVVLEVMGGVRVGEACGGGDGHGALANHLTIARPMGAERGCEDETCELWLADSKTGFSRYVNFVGKSRGIGMEAAKLIRSLWAESGVRVVESIEDGLLVERPDYSVVRVSILDMDETTFMKMLKVITGCTAALIAKHAKASVFYAKLRRKAKGKGEEHKYVNVAGGTLDEANAAAETLRAAGMGRYLDVVPGPLLRATRGHLLTHMPLVPESSYTHIMGAIEDAYEQSSLMAEPDPELDLAGLEKPKWGHHTLRRTGDKVARDTQDVTGAEKGEIDDQFGWNQRERAKDSQLHYAGRRDRSRRARITMML